MRVLALVLLLSACGPLPEAPDQADLGRDNEVTEAYPGEEGDDTGMPQGGQGFDRCKYAICNNPNDRDKASNPVPFSPQTAPLR